MTGRHGDSNSPLHYFAHARSTFCVWHDQKQFSPRGTLRYYGTVTFLLKYYPTPNKPFVLYSKDRQTLAPIRQYTLSYAITALQEDTLTNVHFLA